MNSMLREAVARQMTTKCFKELCLKYYKNKDDICYEDIPEECRISNEDFEEIKFIFKNRVISTSNAEIIKIINDREFQKKDPVSYLKKIKLYFTGNEWDTFILQKATDINNVKKSYKSGLIFTSFFKRSNNFIEKQGGNTQENQPIVNFNFVKNKFDHKQKNLADKNNKINKFNLVSNKKPQYNFNQNAQFVIFDNIIANIKS